MTKYVAPSRPRAGDLRAGSEPRAGQAAVAALFWLLGLALFCGPFLRAPQAADPEGDDPGRTSELDRPFEEGVAAFEAQFGAGLGDAIRAASEERFALDSPELAATGLFDRTRVETGERAYRRFCVGCHGETGDGAGPAARHLEPRPRNFRKGLFKFTSTESGKPPLAADLFQTVTRGLSGSSMPHFALLNEELRWAVVEYVRYLAVRGRFEELMLGLALDEEEVPDPEEVAEIVLESWSEENLLAVYPPVKQIPYDEESVARGREVYMDASGANCVACHGESGRGDGPSAAEFADGWGYPIAPRDLTTGIYRAGGAPADLYRSIATGINGTPMPAFEGSISPEDIWAMVHFLESLRSDG